MKATFDVAVVGSGFAGSLFALLARRVGRSVVLLEKGTHPRFAIGESSSPLANLLLEELCRRYDLSSVAPLCAWGSWQRRYPEIGCGLKRGFTFYGHETGRPFGADPDRRDQLLVAASPRDEVADTHWFRADFDHFLQREAEREGAVYLDRTNLLACRPAPAGMRLEVERLGRLVAIDARFVLDASGPRGFLHRSLGLPESGFRGLPQTEGLYTHFENVRRMDAMLPSMGGPPPPYAADDAALHHVFYGGWIWVLRFSNGAVSAGIAAEPRLAGTLHFDEGAASWARVLRRLPTVAEQFVEARPLRPFVHAPRLPFRSAAAAGGDWALMPSAAAFVDPLLSAGIPLALLGIERLIAAVEGDWGRPRFARSLEAYEAATLRDADAAALLIAALYASFSDFELFGKLTLLYFASASYAEAARRLGRPERAGSFLSADHPTFGPELRAACDAALEGGREGGLAADERTRLLARIEAAIEPLDVGGFAVASRCNWHPVEAGPLLAGAGKLGVRREDVQAMLEETGFFPAAGARGSPARSVAGTTARGADLPERLRAGAAPRRV